jgi:formylglycine-generating enzyme required for sulfatase activity
MAMKFRLISNVSAKYFCPGGVWLFLMLFTACAARGSDGSLQTPEKYREIITVIPAGAGAAVYGGGSEGVFIEGRALALAPYGIARYELAWELWDEVCSRAAARGYRIANRGLEGHDEGGAGLTAAQRKLRPVTGITWRDAIVWCNAYSEMQALEPVYYESEGGPVLKESLVNRPPAGGLPATAADLVFVKPGAKGFRLPTEAEWEFAARGGDQNAADWNYPYPGSSNIEDVAWYLSNSYERGEGNADYGAHPVGSKTGGTYGGANRLGLYDMGGNVSEYCWDWFGAVTAGTPPAGPDMGTFAHRVMRGGGWSSYAQACQVARSRNYVRPWVGSVYVGFRIGRSL